MTIMIRQPMCAGIIGAGFMASTHSRAIRAAGGVVMAAAGAAPDRADAAAAATGAQFGVADAITLIERADVDVVHICTPNNTHAQFAIAALKAGKHVVVEKPLATQLSDAQEIAQVAQQMGRLGSVPFVYRFHPLVREMRARIARGELGVRSVVHGSYLQDWLAGEDETNWRVDGAVGGASRAFADIGSHWCDLYEFVSGERIIEVSARFRTIYERQNQGATEDAATVQFMTDCGTLGTLVVSQVSAGRKNRLHLEISGSQTSFAFDQEAPEALWLGGRDTSRLLHRGEKNQDADAARLSYLPAGHPQGYQDCFNAFMADSYQRFAGSAVSGLPELDAGVRAAQICTAVLQSAHSKGAWVTL